MPDSVNFYVVYLTFAIIVCAFINVYAWRHAQARGSRAFAAANLFAIVWMTGDVVGKLSQTFDDKWIGESLRYLGITMLPVGLLLFVMQYCGKNVRRRNVFLLMIVPMISWCLMLTNPLHHFFFQSVTYAAASSLKMEFGKYFWFVHLPYCYGLMLYSFRLLLLELNRSSHHHRKQIWLLLISFCVPFAVNVVGISKILGNNVSYTPLSIPIFLTIIAFAIFRYRFLSSNPIAYETVFKTIRDGVVIVDAQNIIHDINHAAASGLGKKPREVIGQPLREVFSQWDFLLEKYENAPDLSDEVEIEVKGRQRFYSIGITPLLNSQGTLDGRIFMICDITDRRRQQLSLETLAFHDPLTRLANRRKFEEEFDLAVKKTDATGEPLAILYFDLNRFKSINDTFGHAAGDELLKYVAARVASILRKPDVLARLGGDEFALLLHNCDENGVELVVERLLDNVQRPFKIGDATLIADLSIGAAFYPENGENLNELLRHADLEMYRAKQSGGGFAVITQKIELPPEMQI
ncbi:MAG TPA: diguanylate cyclase [Pyrinomonadaceae bacterium]|nr:diguanylate cyclase [Pyrinomonadaceae bacterium]